MFVISVIPLSVHLGAETLTYFSHTELHIGSVISCPLQTRTIMALVVEVSDAREVKDELRRALYHIRKIEKGVIERPIFDELFLRAAQKTSLFFCVSFGRTLASLVPAFVLEDETYIHSKKNRAALPETNTQEPALEEYAIEGGLKERVAKHVSLYHSLQGSLHIIFPTIEALTQYKDILETQDLPVYVLHSKITGKKRDKTLLDMYSHGHSILLTTVQYLVLTKEDTESIVIESYGDSLYTYTHTVSYDMRYMIETYARLLSIPLYRSDICLLEIDTKETALPTMVEYANMSEKEYVSPRTFLFSKRLEEALRQVQAVGSHAFLYVGRKGYATETVCADCKKTLVCTCGGTLILYDGRAAEDTARHYACTLCDKQTVIDKDHEYTCNHCGSWRLSLRGIGTETVAEYCREHGYTVFECSSDTTKTNKEIKGALSRFYSSKGAVLVGTDLALRHITKKIPCVAIVSFDSLLSRIDYNADEQALRTLVLLQEISSQYFLVQSRKQNSLLLESFSAGTISLFKQQVLAEKKLFHYPPFGVKVTLRVPEKSFAENKKVVEHIWGAGQLLWVYTHRHYEYTCTMERSTWEEKLDIQHYFSSLPPHICSISIDQ